MVDIIRGPCFHGPNPWQGCLAWCGLVPASSRHGSDPISELFPGSGPCSGQPRMITLPLSSSRFPVPAHPESPSHIWPQPRVRIPIPVLLHGSEFGSKIRKPQPGSSKIDIGPLPCTGSPVTTMVLPQTSKPLILTSSRSGRLGIQAESRKA
jgi:hypothetical protein